MLSRNQKLELLAVTGTMHRVFAMRLDTPPFDNNDVRLALKFAARRQEMVDKVLLGYGQIGNDHSISPTQKYFNTDHRSLTLSGEAYFDVQKGNKPFTISTNQGQVTVLGTSFNVRSRADGFEIGVN